MTHQLLTVHRGRDVGGSLAGLIPVCFPLGADAVALLQGGHLRIEPT